MPDWTPDIRRRLAGLRFDAPREAEVVAELSQHLDDRYADLLADGTDEAEARRVALDDLEDAAPLASQLRPLRQASTPPPAVVAGATRTRPMADLAGDLRYASRLFRREPGFVAAVVATLALGLGANTALFSLIDATLLRQLPVRAPEALAYVYNGQVGNVFSYPAYVALRDHQTTAEGLAAWGGITASLAADGDTDLVSGVIVTGNFFEVLGVGAGRGRVLSAADDETPGAHPVAVIGDGLWARRFGRRDDIVGHTIRLNGQPFTIVGVAEPAFIGPQLGTVRDLYVPMMMQAVMRPPRAGYSGEMDPDLLRNPRNGWLFGVARLKAGLTAERAGEELSLLATNFARTLDPAAPARRAPVVPVGEADATERQRMRSIAWLLGGVVGSVLLIACVNVANLLLSRMAARRRELAVRLALGASRARLTRQLVAEAVLLAGLGGAAGMLLAWAAVGAFDAAPPPAGALPVALDVHLGLRVLVVSGLLTLVTGVAIGCLSAFTAARPALVPGLKDDSAQAPGAARGGLRRLLVTAEIAAALALVLASALFVRSLQQAYAIDSGVDESRLVSASLNINLLRYTREQGRRFYQQAIEGVEALPGVESASVSRVALFVGGGRTLSLLVEGREGPDARFSSEGGRAGEVGRDTIRANVVGRGFFSTLGIRLVAGRDFGPEDIEDGPPVAVLSQSGVRRHFADVDAIGQRVSFTGPDGPWVQVVGVVEDSNYAQLGEDPQPVAYLPLSQNHETGMVLYVRASGPPATLVAAVRRVLQTLEPNLPVPDVQPVSQTIASSLYVPRVGAWLLSAFGVLALVLAGVGVYGVLAFATARRTRELGVRMALGATRRQIVGLVLRDGAGLVAPGVMAGLAGALLVARVAQRYLYGIDVYDATTFAVTLLTLVAVAGLACAVPARRAARVDPVRSLRTD